MLRVLLVTGRGEIADALRDDPGRQHYRVAEQTHDRLDVAEVVREFEIVLIDLDTTPDGVSLGRSLRAKKREIEFIPIASPERERQAVEALKAGAFDYQLWPPTEPHDFWTLLGRCVKKLQPEPAAPFPRPFGRFTLLRRLGVGGMAEVFLAEVPATQTSPARSVVIKQMLPNLAGDDEFVRMFMDETRISSMLIHPNIVRVADFGRQGDALYMTMEWVPGRNLEELRREVDAPFPPGLACHIVAEICAGLGHAHKKADRNGVALGIVHRDVNPPNVLVADDGRVMIMDFGIAKAAHRYYETTSGVLKGKFEYMSPEQAHGVKIDHRADLFSVGLILYELLAAARPFQAATPVETLFLIQECHPQPPSVHEPRIPPELDRIVMKALARDVGARYQDASEFEWALREFARKTSNPGPADVAAFSRVMGVIPPAGKDHSESTVPGVMPAGAGAGAIPAAPANEQTRAPDKIPMGAIARPPFAKTPPPVVPRPATIPPRIPAPPAPVQMSSPPPGFRAAPAPPPGSPRVPPRPNLAQTPPAQSSGGGPQKATIIGPLPSAPAAAAAAGGASDAPDASDATNPGVPFPPLREGTGTDIVKLIRLDLEEDLASGARPVVRPDEPTHTNEDAIVPAAPSAARDPQGTVIRQDFPLPGFAAKPDGGVVPGGAVQAEGSGATLFPGSARRADRRRRALQIGGVLFAGCAVLAIAVPLGRIAMRGPAPAPTPYVVSVVKPTGTAGATATATTAPSAAPTATVAVTVTIVATPALAQPTPTAVAVLSPRVVAAATPSPTARPAVAKGTLSLWVDGWATVEIDGKQLNQTAPFVGVPVPAGKHTLTYFNQWTRRETTITIKPGAETKLTLDLKN